MVYRNLEEYEKITLGSTITLTYLGKQLGEHQRYFREFSSGKVAFKFLLESQRKFSLLLAGEKAENYACRQEISLKLGRSFFIEYPNSGTGSRPPDSKRELPKGFFRPTPHFGSHNGPISSPTIRILGQAVRHHNGDVQLAIEAPCEIVGGTDAPTSPEGSDSSHRYNNNTPMLQTILPAEGRFIRSLGTDLGIIPWGHFRRSKRYRPRLQKKKPEMSMHCGI